MTWHANARQTKQDWIMAKLNDVDWRLLSYFYSLFILVGSFSLLFSHWCHLKRRQNRNRSCQDKLQTNTNAHKTGWCISPLLVIFNYCFCVLAFISDAHDTRNEMMHISKSVLRRKTSQSKRRKPKRRISFVVFVTIFATFETKNINYEEEKKLKIKWEFKR